MNYQHLLVYQIAVIVVYLYFPLRHVWCYLMQTIYELFLVLVIFMVVGLHFSVHLLFGLHVVCIQLVRYCGQQWVCLVRLLLLPKVLVNKEVSVTFYPECMTYGY